MTVNLADPSLIGGFFIVFRAASMLNDVALGVDFDVADVNDDVGDDDC